MHRAAGTAALGLCRQAHWGQFAFYCKVNPSPGHTVALHVLMGLHGMEAVGAQAQQYDSSLPSSSQSN